MAPLYKTLCSWFKVPENSGILQIQYCVSEEMYPDQLVFDIRAKAKVERTAKAMNAVCDGIVTYVEEQGIETKARVRIEVFDPTHSYSSGGFA